MCVTAGTVRSIQAHCCSSSGMGDASSVKSRGSQPRSKWLSICSFFLPCSGQAHQH